ncbi:MAG: YkgJ family cysteine cluster protein [Nitrospirae bacterium]|nr:YkgJ family cysteine cluster protein [Nitrospirota bacterium]
MDEIFSKIRKNPIDPIRLTENARFKFKCHKGIACFNKCCGDLDIFLTPYDIIRMKNRFNQTSGQFLLEHTEQVITEKTLLPMIKLKMGEDKRCRFVSADGCTIYKDRPISCRYYPMGVGTLDSKDTTSKDVERGNFYFMIKEDHCMGFNENSEQNIMEWRVDQEIADYDEINKDWVKLILNRKMSGSEVTPDEKSVRMFFIGCYDIDSFKNFVFESKFLSLFKVESELIERMKTDDVTALKLALKWLLYALFREPTMNLNK